MRCWLSRAAILTGCLLVSCSEATRSESNSAALDASSVDSSAPTLEGGLRDSGSHDSGTADAALDASADGATPLLDGGPLDPQVHLRVGRPRPEVCDAFREATVLGARMCGCDADSDCIFGDNGRCSIDHEVRFCTYDDCFNDGHCADGYACACNASPYGTNTCVPSQGSERCVIDAGCGVYKCGLHRSCGGGSGRHGLAIEFRCHTALDQCTIDADCGDPARFCAWGGPGPDGRWIDDRWMCNAGCSVGPPRCP